MAIGSRLRKRDRDNYRILTEKEYAAWEEMTNMELAREALIELLGRDSAREVMQEAEIPGTEAVTDKSVVNYIF